MTENKGIVYLVGAGPGDPGLITLKGRECIERADVVVYAVYKAFLVVSFAAHSADFLGCLCYCFL